MKKILLTVMAITLLASCGLKHERKGTTAHVSLKKGKASTFYEKALKLGIKPTIQRDSILNAIVLLDSAIAIDSEYSKAYLLKQSYQIRLGDHNGALKTIKILEKIKPNDPELRSAEGLYHLLNSDSQSARVALMQSDSLWNIRLDTISPNNDFGLLSILLGKACVLKLLGKEKESDLLYNRILNDTIFNKQEYQGAKKDIDSLFLKQSKEAFYNYLVRSIKKNESQIR